jgi:hypothetical protein
VSLIFFIVLNFLTTSFAGSSSRFFASFQTSSPQHTGIWSRITPVDPLSVPVPRRKDFGHLRQRNSRYVVRIPFRLTFLTIFGRSLKKAYTTERQVFFSRLAANRRHKSSNQYKYEHLLIFFSASSMIFSSFSSSSSSEIEIVSISDEPRVDKGSRSIIDEARVDVGTSEASSSTLSGSVSAIQR